MTDVDAPDPHLRAAIRLERHAHVLWLDHEDGGSGRVRGSSRAFCSVPFSRADTADAEHAATTPGELLAAALSASFVMTLGDLLAQRGTPARELTADATCEVEDAGSGGRMITAAQLQVHGRAPGLDAAAFSECAERALASCTISRALRPGVPVSLETRFNRD